VETFIQRSIVTPPQAIFSSRRHWTPRCSSSAFAAPAILSKAAFYPSKSKFNKYHFNRN
jgi:hypothetical protein